MDNDELKALEKRLAEIKLAKLAFEDRMHHLQMSMLTSVARQILPGGYWSKNLRHHDDHTAHGVNITFDDGPEPATTSRLIEILAAEGVKASFFFLGQNARRHPHLVQAVHKAGHTVANHSMSHPFLPLKSVSEIEAEIDETNAILRDITGETPTLFRPPYGIMDSRLTNILAERRMSTVYWNNVANDWMPIGAEAVVERILRRLPQDRLIVLHEEWSIAGQCLAATSEILKRTKAMGLKFEAIR